MTITELIKLLEETKEQHGDLPCEVHDGMDPSDYDNLNSLDVVVAEHWCQGPNPGKKALRFTTWNQQEKGHQ